MIQRDGLKLLLKVKFVVKTVPTVNSGDKCIQNQLVKKACAQILTAHRFNSKIIFKL